MGQKVNVQDNKFHTNNALNYDFSTFMIFIMTIVVPCIFFKTEIQYLLIKSKNTILKFLLEKKSDEILL